MTNTALLKSKIASSGYKSKFVAEQLKITYQGFLNKLNNKSEFLISEAETLRLLLRLDDSEFRQIFFAEDADCKSTSIAV